MIMSTALSGLTLANENWPQWRGPSFNGTSDSRDLPLSWSETENVKWKVPLPSWSGATPIVWGDRVFVTSPSPAGSGPDAPTVKGTAGKRIREGRDLLLMCFAKGDGSLRWRRKLADGNVHYGKQNMASPSPVTDGRHVWAMTGTGILTARDMDGEFVWRRDLQADYGKFGLLWGYASSPLLFDGKLIIEVLHGMNTDDPSYLLAVEPATGKPIWKVDRPTDAPKESPDAYTTPIPHRYTDRAEIIIAGGDYITGHDPKTGREVWRCGGLNPTRDEWWRAVCSPLIVGDLAFASVKKGPLVACRIGGKGRVTDTHLAWTSELATDVPTPVSDGKYLYVLHDRGTFSCLDPETGRAQYAKKRLPRGTYSASPLLAGGRIYVTSERARTTVLAAGPEFKVLAENPLEDSYTLSSIAVAGNDLFIRTSSHLYCVSSEVHRPDVGPNEPWPDGEAGRPGKR